MPVGLVNPEGWGNYDTKDELAQPFFDRPQNPSAGV